MARLALRFNSTAIRLEYYKPLFGSKETIVGLGQGVVMPNVGLRGMFFSLCYQMSYLMDAVIIGGESNHVSEK